MSSPKSLRLSEDYHHDLPDNVVDEILERMPILTAARASVLSKQWRRSWLSLKRLVFDSEFWRALCRRESNEAARSHAAISSQCEATISRILHQHDDSPIHEFFLLKIPELNYNQWLRFLSKNRVKKIVILYFSLSDNPRDLISSSIFSCTDSVHLHLSNIIVNHVPAGFKGFPNLKHLQLDDIKFTQPNVCGSLIASCRNLSVLSLKNCTGTDVVDLPNLQSLTVNGTFESLVFGNFPALKSISLCIKSTPSTTVPVDNIKKTVKSINHVAQSSQLESLHLGGFFAKIRLACAIKKPLLVAFNHLKKLCLSYEDSSNYTIDVGVVVWMIEICPRIEELDILDVSKMGTEMKHSKNLKLNHLRKVKITGISGTSVELQLIEYLLEMSQVLEELWYQCDIRVINTQDERKVFKALTRFTRTSPKAKVLCMED